MRFDENNNVHLEYVDESYPHFDLLQKINNDSFPENERCDLKLFTAHQGDGIQQMYAVVDGEVPVGFVIWNDIGDGYVYWMYLAIDPQYRNRKYGTKTERLVFDEVLRGKTIFGGIEVIDPAAENYEQRISRKKFHERNGFHTFDKVFELGTAGRFQVVCNDPSESADELAEKLFGVMARNNLSAPTE